MPAAQNRHVEDGGFGAGEAEGDGPVALAQTRNGLAKPAHAPRVGLSETVFDQAAQVAAVDQARNKAKAILAPMAVRAQPIPEMIGIVGESAHVRRPDVQAMAVVFGLVSEPAADLRAGFYQGEANPVAGAFQEMRRHQGAARAASDDGDRARIRPSRWLGRSEHGARIPLMGQSQGPKGFDKCLLS